jgi:hypothetical protein
VKSKFCFRKIVCCALFALSTAAACVAQAGFVRAQFRYSDGGATTEFFARHVDSDGNTGLKIKLTPSVPGGAVTFRYWNHIAADALFSDGMISMMFLPAVSAVPETDGVMILLEDVFDDSRQLAVTINKGTRHYGSLSTYGAVSFYNDLMIGSYGYVSLRGSEQHAAGYDGYGTATYSTRGTINVGRFGDDGGGHSVFSGTESVPLKPLSVYFAGSNLYVNGDGETKLLADICDDRFLSASVTDLPLSGEWGAVRDRYTREYANNLFPSGKVKMSLKFNNVQSGGVAFNLYSVAGLSFADYTLQNGEPTDDSAPSVRAQISSNALKNIPYPLPRVTAVDNADGQIASVGLEITSPSGVKTANPSGFTPSETGKYTFKYSAQDSSGLTGKAVYEIDCYGVLPETIFTKTGGADLEAEYAVKETVTLPAFKAEHKLHRDDVASDVYAVVQRGNRVAESFADAGVANAFTIGEKGTYSVVYVSRNALGLAVSKKMFVFEAVEKPIILSKADIFCGYLGETAAPPRVEGFYKGSYTALTPAVTSPSGGSVATDGVGKFLLSEYGDYSLTYTFTADGVTAVKTVIYSALVPNGGLFVSDGATVVKDSYAIPEYSQNFGQKGVFIHTDKQSSSFSYRNNINLYGLDKNDNLISFASYSDNDRFVNFSVQIVLTDAADPSNKITVTVQPHGGMPFYAYAHVNYDGRTLARSNENGGAMMNLSQYGALVVNSIGTGYGLVSVPNTSLQFDIAENAVYITTDKSGSQWQLLDLDDALQVGAGKEWKGFSGGEITLDVVFSVVKKSAGVIVTEVAGHSVTGQSVAETSAPYITLTEPDCFAEQDGAMPDAKTGKAYPLPSAAAYDVLFGECAAEYGLYAVGGDENIYPLVSGGKIIFPSPGQYVYEITSSNLYGETVKRSFNIEVKSSIDDITVAFASSPVNVSAGGYYAIPDIVTTGGSGRVVTEYTVKLNGRTIAPNNLGEVFLDEPGTLSLSFTARDYIGTPIGAGQNLTIAVTAGVAPVISVEGVPHAAVRGRQLLFPDFTAIDYAYTPSSENYSAYREVTVNGAVIFSGKGDSVSGNLLYAVPPYYSGVLNVKYRAGADAGNITAEKSFTVPVVAGTAVLDYLLQYDTVGTASVAAGSDEAGSKLVVNGDAGFMLANPVGANKLILRFNTDAAKSSFDHLIIRFTDYDSGRVGFFIKIFMQNGNAYMQINGGGRTVPVDGSFAKNDSAFYLVFDSTVKSFKNSSDDVIATVKHCASGLVFDGFAGGRVRLAFEICGVVAGQEGSLIITQIGNQMFTQKGGAYTDAGPMIVLEKAAESRTVKINDEITVPVAIAADILSPFSSVRVTVVSPSGILSGINDAECGTERKFIATEYGYYRIRYTAVDSTGKTAYHEINIYVKDREPPQIEVSGGVQTEHAAGGTLAIPQAVTSDNYSEVTLFIFVVRHDGKIVKIGAELSYVFDMPGNHKLVYYAYDADYNTLCKEYILRVK